MTDLLEFSLTTEDKQAQIFEEFAESKALEFKNFHAGGTFPVPEKLLRAIRVELGSSEPSVVKLVDLICKDPLLSMRIVSLVNFPAYARTKSTRTVKGAIQQLGFMRLLEVFKELSEAQDFTKVFANKLLASDYYQRILTVSLLAQKLVRLIDPTKDKVEEALIGAAAQALPCMLLAFYRPAAYATCVVDALIGQSDFEKSFKRLFHSTYLEIGESMLSNMSMPKEYSRLLTNLAVPVWNKRSWSAEEREEMQSILISIYVAEELCDEIFKYDSQIIFEERVKEIAKKISIDAKTLLQIISEVPGAVSESIEILGLYSLRYPTYLTELSAKQQPELQNNNRKIPLSNCLAEIKTNIAKIGRNLSIGDMQQAVYKTLMTLVKVLGFDRAILLRHDEKTSHLKPLLNFGLGHNSMYTMSRSTATHNTKFKPDLEAFLKHKIVFQGDPLFGEDWPFVAFPMLKSGKSIGVFYADHASKESANALSMEEQLSLTALAELWHELK